MHGAGGGARKGNKNAVKHGAMVAESIAVRREVQALARMARKTIAAIGLGLWRTAGFDPWRTFGFSQSAC
jgi:hypothetical protein